MATKTASQAIDLAPRSNLGEMEWRGERIIHTDDVRLVGGIVAGFAIAQGFVVRDAFDEPTLPVSMQAFFTPWDAIAAIEMRDTVLPTIKEHTPTTTLVYEYNLMWAYRQNYWMVHHALQLIQNALDDAVAFDDNPARAVGDILHGLRQNIAQARGPK